MSRMTQAPEEVSQALRWYFGGGLGAAMLCMAALGLTHRGLDPTGTTMLGRVRIVFAPAIALHILISLLGNTARF